MLRGIQAQVPLLLETNGSNIVSHSERKLAFWILGESFVSPSQLAQTLAAVFPLSLIANQST